MGHDNAFARQLSPLARRDDVALRIATSGTPPDVLGGCGEARRRGLLTVALVGHDGGRAAGVPGLDHVIVTPGDYVPRLQEVQGTACHLLLEAVGGRP